MKVPNTQPVLSEFRVSRTATSTCRRRIFARLFGLLRISPSHSKESCRKGTWAAVAVVNRSFTATDPMGNFTLLRLGALGPSQTLPSVYAPLGLYIPTAQLAIPAGCKG